MNKEEVVDILKTEADHYIKGILYGWKSLVEWVDANDRVKSVAIGARVYNELLGDIDFVNTFHPSSGYALLTSGVLGHFVSNGRDVPVVCDAYFHPNERYMDYHALKVVYMNGSATQSGFKATQQPKEPKMHATDPGHVYQLADGQTVRFIKKVKNEKTGAFDTVHVGTTNEELLELLIDRTNFVNSALSSPENEVALHHMKKALTVFNARTAARQLQNVEATPEQHKSAQSIVDEAKRIVSEMKGGQVLRIDGKNLSPEDAAELVELFKKNRQDDVVLGSNNSLVGAIGEPEEVEGAAPKTLKVVSVDTEDWKFRFAISRAIPHEDVRDFFMGEFGEFLDAFNDKYADLTAKYYAPESESDAGAEPESPTLKLIGSHDGSALSTLGINSGDRHAAFTQEMLRQRGDENPKSVFVQAAWPFPTNGQPAEKTVTDTVTDRYNPPKPDAY